MAKDGYQVPESQPETVREKIYLPELIKGLAVTTKHFLDNLFSDRDTNPEILDRKGANQVSTVSYPDEKKPSGKPSIIRVARYAAWS